MQQVELSEAKARELADNPDNLVYYYKEREPLKSVVPLEDVESNVLQCWADFQWQRKQVQPEMTKKKFDKIKVLLSQKWSEFAFTHPLIFDRIVHPETRQAEIDAILYMIQLKKAEPGDTGRVKLAKHVMDTFAVSREEWANKHPNSQEFKLDHAANGSIN